ncbi:hypothetical protein M9H77_28702 [Catharanthus roseus]|uniref:Uncharacterized protein n=1 Tax=Catharanthus roseus TaxID=4058 RepID=A0ACC0AIC1_CATRO|nr:hypothetical protein M9H77_28702 [Catharanthus roseus]
MHNHRKILFYPKPKKQASKETEMATAPYSTLQLSNPNALFSSLSPRSSAPLKVPQLSFTICRATTGNEDSSDSSSSSSESDQIRTETSNSDQDNFDSRLSQIRLRYRSGQGKKSEVRKTKKGGGKKGSSGSAGIFLPPVPLKQPVSEGLNVELGFSPYSERINGRIALVGLTALILVELATGKGVINYHTPAIVLIQIYFMAAASALYVKYEKEKVSVWPRSSPADE